MKLLFMGTAAAEGIPALFCECEYCRYARKTGGRLIRSRAGALIDGKLKLDFGPDSFMQMLRCGVEYGAIHSVLITHSHEDHLDINDLGYRRDGYATFVDSDPRMTVYGNEAVGALIETIKGSHTFFKRVTPFETCTIEGYEVTPLEAVHCLDHSGTRWKVMFEGREYHRSEEALFYLIEKDGKRVLYAHDTDEFTPGDIEFLKGKRCDLISLDCTNACKQYDYVGHMGYADDLRMRDKLIKNGTADGQTVFVANHFSHNGFVMGKTLEELMPGFVIAYDGLELEV